MTLSEFIGAAQDNVTDDIYGPEETPPEVIAALIAIDFWIQRTEARDK